MPHAAPTRVPAILLATHLLGCGGDGGGGTEPEAAARAFAGSFRGTYTGTGGCLDQTVGGGLSFTIRQEGRTLTVSYKLDQPVNGLEIFGGAAEVAAGAGTSFSGPITSPAGLTGTFAGTLAADGRAIEGAVDGSALTLCGGAPRTVPFRATYRGTR